MGRVSLSYIKYKSFFHQTPHLDLKSYYIS